DHRRPYQRHILVSAREEASQWLALLPVLSEILFRRHGVLRRQRCAGRHRAAQSKGRYQKRYRSVDHPRAEGVEGEPLIFCFPIKAELSGGVRPPPPSPHKP